MAGKKGRPKKKKYHLKTIDFNTSKKPDWCYGCGDYGIWKSIKKTFVSLNLKPHEILMVYGVGCSGNCLNFLKTYAFHALHGRALPVATGAKLANHKLNVIIMGGDGDGTSIGGNHFIHTCRRNINMTYFLCNNKIYGLTKGQASPTSNIGFKTRSTPLGVRGKPINPVLLALSAGATFVARGFAGDIKHLTNIMKKAIKHRGFSFIDIIQPCITLNKVNTYDFYREKVYDLHDIKDYDSSDLNGAIRKSMEKEKIPLGIFYKFEEHLYEEGLKQIERKPLVDHIITDIDVNRLFNSYY
ncbi:MAG: 2-oxoacid:ferredoxin oxidoreductase subunit beta [Actinomycetota bacterium]|nr:2-oxoacid:ferredoxin oxidoreductase subunit beta [Actinomycetota bacterium]